MRTTVITNAWALEERAAEIGPYTDRLGEIARSPEYTEFTKRAEACCACRDFGTVELSNLWEGRPGSLWNAVKILV